MNHTLGQLIEACQLRTGFNDSAYYSRWRNFVNRAIRDYSREQPWDGLEQTETFTTDGTRYLVLPSYVDSVISLTNGQTGHPIECADDLEKSDPLAWSQVLSGVAHKYTRAGQVPVTKSPSGYLWFSSSSASDVGAIHVTGFVANSAASGQPLARTFAELSMNAQGTSGVTLTTLFTDFISISKASETNGDFFFYDAGASNAPLAFIAKSETASGFRRLALHFKPASGVPVQVRFRYKLSPIVSDAQAPHPSVKPDYVVEKAIHYHQLEQEQYQKAQLADAAATRVLAGEAQKERIHNEVVQTLVPRLPDAYDESYDFYRRW